MITNKPYQTLFENLAMLQKEYHLNHNLTNNKKIKRQTKKTMLIVLLN